MTPYPRCAEEGEGLQWQAIWLTVVCRSMATR